MGFYHTETNPDIHRRKPDAISHGKKNNTRNVESRDREREAREIRNKAFRELKKGCQSLWELWA